MKSIDPRIADVFIKRYLPQVTEVRYTRLQQQANKSGLFGTKQYRRSDGKPPQDGEEFDVTCPGISEM